MPNRILREGILSSERVALLTWQEEVFYRRLMSVVDDFGRYHANPKLLRAALYPLLIDKVSDADVGKWLTSCVTAALVSVYPAPDGKRYLEMLDFRQQARAKDSKYPPMQGKCAADATQAPSKRGASAHLDGGGGVFEDGGVSGDGDGDGGGTRARASPAAEVCKAIRQAGIPAVSPSNPTLLALLDAGATLDEFIDAAPKALGKSDGFSYLLGVVKGRREDAASAAKGMHRGPMPTAAPAETTYQRSQRERMAKFAPGVAAKKPGAPPAHNVIDMEPAHGTPIALG